MKSPLPNLRALFRRRTDPTPVPLRFKFTLITYGPGAIRRRTLELRHGCLWTDCNHTGLVIVPVPARWRRFRAEMDSIGVWAWRHTYDDCSTIDGGGWALEIQYADRKLDSKGHDAYPGVGGKPLREAERGRPDNPFPRFCKAVSRLIPEGQAEAFGWRYGEGPY
jgi:hypothetical protein